MILYNSLLAKIILNRKRNKREQRWFGHHSSFDWEALEYCGDTLYLRKRKFCAWMKWYGKRTLPPSEWED